MVGDFNINLTNYKNHTVSKNFADLLFSIGLYPLINKPTRISFDTVTLIDNIFTNITTKTINSILINNVSDRLPIFTLAQNDLNLKRKNKEVTFKSIITKENLSKLNSDINDHNWDNVP